MVRPLNHLPMDLAWPRPPGPGGIGDETLLMARNLVEAARMVPGLGRWERQRTKNPVVTHQTLGLNAKVRKSSG